MDLEFSPAEEAFRAECRAWLDAHVPRPALPSGDTREGFAAHLEWERTLFDARYAVVSWPEAYGGRDASLWEWLIFEEEYYRAGAPQRVTQNGIFLLAPTIFEFGTPEQQDRILPKMASGEETWCQGWSEPNAGSDLAGIQSKATRDDAAGGWRLSGQKTWTTRGAFCTHLFGLFRTDPGGRAAPRPHVLPRRPLDAGRDRARPVERLDGDEGFAEVFFDDVFVPDTDVLGEPNQGWSVAMATTGSERGLTLRSPGRFLATAQRLIDLYHERGDDPEVRDRLVAAWIDAEAYRWQTFWTVTRLVEGQRAGAESSLVKLFWSELDVRLHELALELLGDARGARRRRARGLDEGLSVRARRPDLRGHERDPAQRRRRTRARTAETMRVRASPTTSSSSATRCASCSRRSARPRIVRDAWTNDTGRVPGLWDKLAEMGVVGLLVPEARAASGLTSRPRAHPRGDRPARGAGADRRDGRVRRAAARRSRRSSSRLRTSSCRGPTRPTSSSPPRVGSIPRPWSSPRDRRSTARGASSR